MITKSQTNKGKLDPITFFYGFGAAIVLIASIFKFVGLDYATEMFVFGLSIEALVFLISAFESKESVKEYAWENVFPQLVNKNANANPLGNFQGPLPGIATGDLENKFEKLGQEVLQMQASLNAFTKYIESNTTIAFQSMQSMEKMNKEIKTYNEHLERVNQKLQLLRDQQK